MLAPKTSSLYVERHSANDESYILVERLVGDKDRVIKGQAIATLEGSKAAFEVTANASGFVKFAANLGETVPVGALLSWISDDKDTLLSINKSIETAFEDSKDKRFTRKARELLSTISVDLNVFNNLDLVTEDDVRRLATPEQKVPIDELISLGKNRIQRIAILGASFGAIQVSDIVQQCKNQRIVMLYDDDLYKKSAILGLTVSGTINKEKILEDYQAGKFDALVNSMTFDLTFRRKVFEELSDIGIPFTNVIHPSSSEGSAVVWGVGNVICANVTIGSCTTIGDNNFISACSNIEHHSTVGSHNAFGPGVVTSGRVRIGSQIRFGMGIFIEPRLLIGDDSTIASGAVLTSDIPPRTLVKLRSNLLIQNKVM